MKNSFADKTVFGLIKAITYPRSSLSWVRRGHLAKDKVFVSQTYWFAGTLPRVPLTTILPGVQEAEVLLPRAFDRKTGTSISVEEACHLGAIAKCTKAPRVLEIGTYDGNTALVLAANLAPEGQVITVDLPPSFDMEKQDSLMYPFDLIFIDGCHSEAYVRADSQNALDHLAPRGVILWHDYGAFVEVSNVVDRLARESCRLKIFALEGTRLAIGLAAPAAS